MLLIFPFESCRRHGGVSGFARVRLPEAVFVSGRGGAAPRRRPVTLARKKNAETERAKKKDKKNTRNPSGVGHALSIAQPQPPPLPPPLPPPPPPPPRMTDEDGPVAAVTLRRPVRSRTLGTRYFCDRRYRREVAPVRSIQCCAQAFFLI